MAETTGKPSLVVEIPIGKIKVPEDRKRSFDKSDEKTQLFVDNVSRMGILQPVEVRQAGDDYELVFGRLRLWACKQLGLETIPATISTWTDRDLAFVALSENAFRGHLSAAQWALALQKILKEMDLIYGSDPHKAAGGLARSRNAGRNPANGQLVQESRIEPFIAGNTVHDDTHGPASTAAVLAGQTTEIEAPTRSYSAMLSDTIGKHINRTREDIKIASNFSDEQLICLGTCDLSKEDLLRLVNLDPEPKAQAVGLVLGGCGIDEAIESVKVVTPEGAKIDAYLKERDLTDKAFLEVRCAECRDGLQDPATFDREALLYRKDRGERDVHRLRCRDFVKKARAGGWGPLSDLLNKLFTLEHPAKWYICRDCRGRNVNQPYCDGCGGAGFKLRWITPT